MTLTIEFSLSFPKVALENETALPILGDFESQQIPTSPKVGGWGAKTLQH